MVSFEDFSVTFDFASFFSGFFEPVLEAVSEKKKSYW